MSIRAYRIQKISNDAYMLHFKVKTKLWELPKLIELYKNIFLKHAPSMKYFNTNLWYSFGNKQKRASMVCLMMRYKIRKK